MKTTISQKIAALVFMAAQFCSPEISAGTTLWTGTAVLPEDWSGQGALIESSAMTDIEKGDTFVFTLSGILQGNSAWPQLYLTPGDYSSFTPQPIVPLWGYPETASVEYTIDDFTGTDGTLSATDFINKAKSAGLIIKGMGYTLDKVELRKASETVNPVAEAVTEIWTGSETIDWNAGATNNWVLVPSAKFQNVAKDAVMRICFSDLKLNAQGHICAGNWADLADGTDFIPLSGTSYSYTVTDAMLEQLKKDGMVVSGVGYTMKKIEIVVPSLLPDVTAEAVTDYIKVWDKNQTVCHAFSLTNNEDKDVEVDLSLELRTDDFRSLPGFSRTVTLKAGTTVTEKFEVEGLEPGFYHAVLTANHNELADYNFGVDFEGIVSAPDAKDDFDDFWSDALADLADVDIDASLTLLPEKSTSAKNVYLLEMKSIPDTEEGEPVVIRGYYTEPVADGKYPVLISYQGYDSDASTTPWCPTGNDRPGYIELILSTRGQLLNNRAPYVNPYGDWFVYNLGDRDHYYYRGAYMDAVRAIDFIFSREKADQKNVFAQGQSQGGALTFAAAALGGNRLKAIAPAIPFMGDFPDYFRVGAWPSYVAGLKQTETGLTDKDMYDALSYFDTKNMAPRISCPVKMVFGLQDNVCPPHTNVAPYNNLASQKKEASYNAKLMHQTHSSWDREFMDFFKAQQALDGLNVADYTATTDNGIKVFDLGGRMVADNEYSLNVLSPGIYIIKQGSKTTKRIVK